MALCKMKRAAGEDEFCRPNKESSRGFDLRLRGQMRKHAARRAKRELGLVLNFAFYRPKVQTPVRGNFRTLTSWVSESIILGR